MDRRGVGDLPQKDQQSRDVENRSITEECCFFRLVFDTEAPGNRSRWTFEPCCARGRALSGRSAAVPGRSNVRNPLGVHPQAGGRSYLSLRFGEAGLGFRSVLCLLNGCARRGQRGTQIRSGGTGLMMCASGTLNGSSPAANLASANIKGKWRIFHFAGPTRTGQRSYAGGGNCGPMDRSLFIALK
jgi:hypothetical protein